MCKSCFCLPYFEPSPMGKWKLFCELSFGLVFWNREYNYQTFIWKAFLAVGTQNASFIILFFDRCSFVFFWCRDRVFFLWYIFVGIFAFKCARAEELFNMLQEIMQNNSINVVEEPVVERNNHQTELEVPRTPRTPTSKCPFPPLLL